MAFCGYLKQSTAVDILLGPFLDDGDGDTADTDATIDVELSKNGQALADSESAAPSHDAAGDVDGYYNCILGTTDTNTLGILTVVAHHADDLPVRQDYQVVTANWFDSICSTDKLDTSLVQILGAAVAENTGGNIATNFNTLFDDGDDATSTAKMSYIEELAAANLPSDVDAILTDTGTTLENRLIAVEADTDVIDDGTSGLVKIAQDVAAVLVDTGTTIPGTITTAQTDLTAIKVVTDAMIMKDTTIASVDTADTKFILTDGLTANDDINSAVCSIYDATGSVWCGPRKVEDYIHGTKLVEIDENASFTLQAGDRVIIWNGAYATTASAGSVTQGNIDSIADAVWDEAEVDHVTAGSMGDKQRRSDRTGR